MPEFYLNLTICLPYAYTQTLNIVMYIQGACKQVHTYYLSIFLSLSHADLSYSKVMTQIIKVEIQHGRQSYCTHFVYFLLYQNDKFKPLLSIDADDLHLSPFYGLHLLLQIPVP